MFHVENESGSYGNEKDYLTSVANLMRNHGLPASFFTSEGPWRAFLRAGSLITDDILVTGNFGSRANENFQLMQAFSDEYEKTWPLMCMGFWGWMVQ